MKALKIFKWLFAAIMMAGLALAIVGFSLYRFNPSAVADDAAALSSYSISQSELADVDTINISTVSASVIVETHSGNDITILNSARGDVAKGIADGGLTIVAHSSRRVSWFRPNIITVQIPTSFSGDIIIAAYNWVRVKNLNISSLYITSQDGNVRVERTRVQSLTIHTRDGRNDIEIIGNQADFTKTLLNTRRRGRSFINGIRTVADVIGTGESTVSLTASGDNRLSFVAQ